MRRSPAPAASTSGTLTATAEDTPSRPLQTLTDAIARVLARSEPSGRWIAASVEILVLAAITYAAWTFAWHGAQQEAEIRFEFRAGQMADAIRGRMADYEQMLRGGVGLLAASQSVDRDEWATYVRELRIEDHYPGVLAMGLALRIPAAEKAEHERAIRAAGFAGYAIHPPGERAEYSAIVYIEPFSGRNLRALGFDMLSEPAGRAALRQARDSGGPAITGRVTLIQDADQSARAGFLMVLPVYRKSMPLDTAAQRGAAIAGYVFSPFRVDDLVRGILGKLADVRLQLFDGTADPSPLLYDSGGGARPQTPAYSVTVALPMRGRTWTLHLSSLPGLEAAVDWRTPLLVALSTAAISALALGMIGSLAQMRARAARLARSMTQELSDSRERLALALEGSNQALLDWDVASGKVVLSEQWSRIIGAGAQPVTTTIAELAALVHPEDVPRVREQAADLLRDRLPFYRVEHRVRTITGGWRWIASRAKVVERDARGRAVRVAGTNVDITERKEMERLKNEFIATVSHELRTPLTAIIGALGLLKKKAAVDLPPDAAMFLSMAQQNSEQLAALINDVLDLEKIESGLMAFHDEAVAVGPLLERAAALNTPYADKFDVRLELRQPLPDATVTGDADRLLQVMANLISNAVKFSPAGSAVTVSAEVRDDAARVAVADCGPGVPEAFRNRIFEKFAQADGSDTRRKGGTGLGLSICRAIVERLGGVIGYESAPGRGTVFYFELPVRS